MRVFAAPLLLYLTVTQAQSATAQKTPVKAFSIAQQVKAQIPSGLQVHGVRARGNHLYFHCGPGPTATRSVLLRTDLDGNNPSTIAFPPEAEILDFDVTDAGIVYAVAPRGQASDLIRLDFETGSTSRSERGAFTSGICACGESLVFVEPGSRTVAVVTISRAQSRAVPVDLRRPHRAPSLFAIGRHRVALVERADAVVHILDIDQRTTFSFAANAPELAVMSPPAAPSASGLRSTLISAAAAAADGELYLLPGHYALRTGAPIVPVDLNGRVHESWILALPTFKDEVLRDHNEEGQMIAFRIASVDGRVFLVSRSGKVAEYAR